MQNIDSMKKIISKIVLWHRKKSKMNQYQLSISAGVSRTAIQRLEKGQMTIQLDTLFKIFQALNIDVTLDSPLMPIFYKQEALQNAKS